MPDELAESEPRLSAALTAALAAALAAAQPSAADGRTAAAAAAGLAAYDLARLDGLCHDGAWECALEAAHRALAGEGNARK